jgi:hypothetical protein
MQLEMLIWKQRKEQSVLLLVALPVLLKYMELFGRDRLLRRRK